jgi:hypothetical protein
MIEFPRDVRVTQVSDEGPTPSFFIRFRDPIMHLTRNWNYLRSDSIDADSQVGSAAIIVMQRAYSLWSRRLFDRAKAAGIPVIYETDDFFLDLPSQSGFRITDQQKECVVHMLKSADAVTCSTQELAEALRTYSNCVYVLENYAVPLSRAGIESARRKQYSVGVVNTDYFKLIRGKQELFQAFQGALATLSCHLTFFGSIDPQMAALQKASPDQVTVFASFIPRRTAFWEYILSQGINAGVVPLEDNPDHRFKSDIKLLDFSQVGAPAVYNNPRCYNRVIHRETGYMCDGTREGWLSGLAYFADETRRIACGDAAYRYAQGRTLDAYAEGLKEVIMMVLCRRGMPLPVAATAVATR